MKFSIRFAWLALVFMLALSGCNAQPASYEDNSNSSTQKTAPESSSSSSQSAKSGSSSISALADCQAYQSGYNSMRFSEFLESEWDSFTSGGATVFGSQEFLDLWTKIQNGNFPTWDDVGYVVYELCWAAANFEITIPVVEQLPTASTVKEGMAIALAYYCDSPDSSGLNPSTWTVTLPVATGGFFELWAVVFNKGTAYFAMDVRNEGYSLITPNGSLAEEALEAWGCSWPMKVMSSN